MGPKPTVSSVHKQRSSDQSDSETDSDYKRRRERNNIAVKKSREKSRARARLTAQRVAHLQHENSELESKISLLSKELGVLKDLLVLRAGKKVVTGDVGNRNAAEASAADSSSSTLNHEQSSSAVYNDHEYVKKRKK